MRPARQGLHQAGWYCMRRADPIRVPAQGGSQALVEVPAFVYRLQSAALKRSIIRGILDKRWSQDRRTVLSCTPAPAEGGDCRCLVGCNAGQRRLKFQPPNPAARRASHGIAQRPSAGPRARPRRCRRFLRPCTANRRDCPAADQCQLRRVHQLVRGNVEIANGHPRVQAPRTDRTTDHPLPTARRIWRRLGSIVPPMAAQGSQRACRDLDL